ncbi:MAG: NAD-dependent deacylase [Spirochaetaceae bacterium]|nr:MAG: NAD-dependent deacylase [Spirochaetaceae bacterium]
MARRHRNRDNNPDANRRQGRAIADLRQRLAGTGRVVVLTGAGVSAESGIPTFRDAQTGYWQRFRPEDLATAEAFRRDPQTVWRWYAQRRAAVQGVEPNPGHTALARLENRLSEFTLITQNVDGLHARAGSRRVLELHGNLLRVRCFSGCVSYSVGDGSPDARAAFDGDSSAAETVPEVPRCPHCGDYLRPDVVWFGENLPEQAIQRAFGAAESADLFLVVGTSAVVYPAAMLPRTALDCGATVVEINPDRTPLSTFVTLSIRGTAGEVLPRVIV